MSESIDFFQSLFYIQYSKTGNQSYLFGINNNQTFHISNFDIPQSLGRKARFFNPCKNKVTFRASKLYLAEESDLL